MAYDFVPEEPTKNVIISGRFVAKLQPISY